MRAARACDADSTRHIAASLRATSAACACQAENSVPTKSLSLCREAVSTALRRHVTWLAALLQARKQCAVMRACVLRVCLCRRDSRLCLLATARRQASKVRLKTRVERRQTARRSSERYQRRRAVRRRQAARVTADVRSDRQCSTPSPAIRCSSSSSESISGDWVLPITCRVALHHQPSEGQRQVPIFCPGHGSGSLPRSLSPLYSPLFQPQSERAVRISAGSPLCGVSGSR